MLLSLGDQVKPGTYRFHSRFNRVVNFEHDGRLIAMVDEAIGPGPLNIVLRDLRPSQAQGYAETAPAILKGLHHSAQGWIASPFPGDPTLGKRPRKVSNPERVESRPPFDSPLQITPRTVLFAGHRYHFTARHRYDSTLESAVTMQFTEAPLNRRDAADAKRQSRNQIARSVWSARRLLPLSNRPTPYNSASKLDALHTLRAAVHPPKPSQHPLPRSFLCAHRISAVPFDAPRQESYGLEAVDLRRFQRNLSALGESLKETAPPKSLAFLLDGKRRKNFRAGFERAFAGQITRGVHQVFRRRPLQGIQQLKGCGLGLTPAGDDFIAGLLIGLHLLGKLRGQNVQPTANAIFRAARGDNIFSNTFLDLARRGLLFGHMKDLLLALVSGSEGSVRKAAEKLFTVGETSGADLATGLFLTLQAEGRRA